MMSSASSPDFRGTLRRQQSSQRHSVSPSMLSSASLPDLSLQNRQQRPQPVVPAQQAVTTAQSDTLTADPIFEPLERAGRFVNEGIRKDNSFPELHDLVQRICHELQAPLILEEGASSNYQLPEDSSWFPFQRTQILTIPDAIFAQYNKTQLSTQMGLFPEIQRAYITVDNRLYLWNYLNGEDFQSFSDSPQTLLAVRLIPPKTGIFLPSIKYLLALCTSSTFFLLGIDTTPADGTFTIYNADMSVSVAAMGIKCIEASKDGRIFISGTDSHLWEIFYQAEEGWFTSRTRKVCQTGGFGELILPSWTSVSGGQTETIEQIAIDDERKLIYTLGSKSTIRTFHMNSPTTLTAVISYSLGSVMSHISILSANSPLLDPRNTKIIAITPILSQESQRIYLVAITSSRVRLYIRAIKSYGAFGSSGGNEPVNSMQVIHIRIPPEQTGQFSSRGLQPCHFSKLFHPGLFFAAHEPINPSDSDLLFASALDPGRVQLFAGVSQVRMELIESATFVPIEGYVQDICALNSPAAAPWNELASQFDSPPREFAVLTNTGVHIIRRRRAVEILASLIRGSSGHVGAENDILEFFTKYGRQEGCATALAIACGQSPPPPGTVGGINASPARHWHGRPSFGSGGRVADEDVRDIARKCYLEFGGRAVCDEGRLLGRDPTIEAVQLSGRWEGAVLYLSRLLRSVWKQNCFTNVVSVVKGQSVTKYLSNVAREKIVKILDDLTTLSTFFEENKPFIEGLTGLEGTLRTSAIASGSGLMQAGVASRAEEVALQAEHRAMLSIVKFLNYAIQGIEFFLILDEDYSTTRQKLNDVISRLPSEELRRDILKMTFEELFTTAKGREIVKEMVNVMVGLGVSGKTSVEVVTEILRVRCPAFCSGDDVIVYRAIGMLQRAKVAPEGGERMAFLMECLSLFERSAGSLSLENLKDAVDEFRELKFHSGSVQLALAVAKLSDPTNSAIQYVADGKRKDDSREKMFDKRMRCYNIIFEVLDDIESVEDELNPALGRLRQQTYELVYGSDDELFHQALYDWFVSCGHQERLLEIQTPFIQAYLEHQAASSAFQANLLWQFYAKNGNYHDAARVLNELANSNFPVSLEERIEYLSRAKNLCSVRIDPGMRSALNEQATQIQDAIDVATIQDDIIRVIKEDPRMADFKRAEFLKELDGKILPLTTLFNQYADPLGYFEVCLEIFQTADFRNTAEINQCWESIIRKEHESKESKKTGEPFEGVADAIRRLGRRFLKYELIFNPPTLVPMVEKYNLETIQRDGWVPEAFLDAGVTHQTLYSIYDNIHVRQEAPWNEGPARLLIVTDALWTIRSWIEAIAKSTVSRTERVRFPVDRVSSSLDRMMASVGTSVAGKRLRERIMTVRDEIKRRF